MSYKRVAAVTGANKGIGFAIVRNLALQYPNSAFNNGPFLIYLTARDKSRGEAALKDIHSDPQLKKAKALAEHGGLTTVKYHSLDISDKKSIDDFATFLKKHHPQGIDFVINNAAIAMTGFDSNVVKQTLHCNYYGTLEATKQMLPLIKEGGRLVNVASMAGHLGNKYSEAVRNRFLRAKSVPDITACMKSFEEAVQNGSEKQAGFPSAAYAVSKAGIIGMTKVIAKREEQQGSTTRINSCCPGYVVTDMTRGTGSKTPDGGAQTPVLLALGDIGGQTGLFWQDEKPIKW